MKGEKTMEKKEINKLCRKMKKLTIGSDNPEAQHLDADDILCDALVACGLERLVNFYLDVPKWYA